MQKKVLILLCSLFLFSSCFRIEETLILQNDGSGFFGFKVDMSQSKYALRLAKNLSELYDGKSPDEQINRSFSRGLGAIEKTPGISSTQLIKNDDDFIYELSLAFDDLKALNTAVTQFFREEDKTSGELFKFDKRKFERTGAIDIISMVERESKNSKSKISGLDPRVIFKDVTYSMKYVFDNKIKKYSNEAASLSEDEKELELSYHVFDPEESVTPENTIKLRRK
ncbi:MAG: hypothetical protein AAF363_19795 [Bacteroidota bacterium]